MPTLSSSSPPPCSAPPSIRLHPFTFWCHECDMSVSLLTSSSPPPSPSTSHLPCPQCRRLDSLLPLDSTCPLPLTLFVPFSQRSLNLPHPSQAPVSNSDDSIAAIPTVEITDPTAVCAICKDDLPRGSFARRLHCSHLYHSNCIMHWLSLQNSCPLCRSTIPRSIRPYFRIRMLEPEDDVGTTFHQIEVSPAQMRLDEAGSVEPENSGEAVTPEWPVVGGGWAGEEEDELADDIMSDDWEDLFA